MGTHPNAILLLALTPHDLARKTFCDIRTTYNVPEDGDVTIDGEDYHIDVMEEAYDEGMQITAKEGDIVVYDMVTYGYGERVTWKKLEEQKNKLEAWAQEVCKKHHCDYEIFITANYW